MLPKTLKKRAEFIKISRDGARAKTRSLISICLKTENLDTLAKVGYTASKKVGNAVKRNMAKRRLRSLVREYEPEFCSGYSFVFIATSELVDVEYSVLKSDFLYCVKKSKERSDFGHNK